MTNFPYGMHYLMQYDPVRNVVLHFERDEDSTDRLRVWAFRLPLSPTRVQRL